jgi:hypothetical protein
MSSYFRLPNRRECKSFKLEVAGKRADTMKASTITFTELDELRGGKSGTVDTVCPICSPDRRSPLNRRRPVLRTWMPDDGFITYKCARCELKGFARTETLRIDKPRRPASPDNGEAQIDEHRRLLRATAIWFEALPIIDTPGEAYLRERGIVLDDIPEYAGLRWHAACPWEAGVRPCIVSRFTDAVTGAPKGIHRRPITGEKPKTLGPVAGCVIRLWPDAEVGQGLAIGEGVETVLYASRITHRGTLLRPAWAVGGAGNLAKFPVLAGIEALTILVDNDENGAGQRAAGKCAHRWRDAGHEVIRLMPGDVGLDFNDLVQK